MSGPKDLDDREGLSDLMARIRSNGVRTVLVERADRLARDLMVPEVLLAEFRKLGVTVMAADSGTDLTAGDDDPRPASSFDRCSAPSLRNGCLP